MILNAIQSVKRTMYDMEHTTGDKAINIGISMKQNAVPQQAWIHDTNEMMTPNPCGSANRSSLTSVKILICSRV